MRQSSNAITNFLSSLKGPATYQSISQALGMKHVKPALSKLKKKGIVTTVGVNQWLLTEKGREGLTRQLEQLEHPIEPIPPPLEYPLSNEDEFREVGRNLFPDVSSQRLESIVYYVRELTNFRSPISIWNALTDWELSARKKFIWIRVYLAKTSPLERIPEELEEKRSLFLAAEEIV